MADLDFVDKHNMIAMLNKPEGSESFHQIVDFLNHSHLRYALTKKPVIHISHIKQFWQTACVKSSDETVKIHATVDGQKFVVSETSIRRILHLDDSDGIFSMLTTEIFENLRRMGYVTDSDNLTFQKGHFSPQWRFLIHTILHCLSPKKTSFEQFSSNIATAIICLANGQKFNFSKLIFEGLVNNVSSKYKFLMYPRFIQLVLTKKRDLLKFHKKTYDAPSLTNKVFSNMSMKTKGFSGVVTPLFPTMLLSIEQSAQGEGSAIPADSQPTPQNPLHATASLPQPQTETQVSQSTRKGTMVSQPSFPTISPVADETFTGVGGEGKGRAATTDPRLALGQDSGNIIKTQPLPTQVESGSLGPTSTSGPRQMETMGDILDQTRSEKVSKLNDSPLSRGNTLGSEEGSMKPQELMATTKLNESPLSRVNTLGSDEGSLKLKELTVTCATLSDKVTSLENELKYTKKIYNQVYLKLSQRLEKVEKKLREKEKKNSTKEDSPKQGRKDSVNQADVEGRQAEQTAIGTAEKEIETAAKVIETVSSDPTTSTKLVSTAEEQDRTASEISNNIPASSSNPDNTAEKADGTASTRCTSPIREEVPADDETLAETLLAIKRSGVKDKGKRVVTEEPEQPKKKFKTERAAQEEYDAELAKKLHLEELEAEKKEKEKEEQKSRNVIRKHQIDFLISQGYLRKRFQKMSSEEVNKTYEREFKSVQEKTKKASSPRNAKRAADQSTTHEKSTKHQKATEILKVKLEHGAELEKKRIEEEQKMIEEKKEKAETEEKCLEESSKSEKERDKPET